ncbi:MAG: hypothetical protein HOE69_04925 [Euryarchaeota archaeon]|jgi:hypothetical protein|nr:hypothetical protein [Euryarchaeota archaeon]MBT4059633.1 hypothetical protein [Euryarchaeota archaeon]
MTDVNIEPGMIGSLILLGMIGLFITIGIIWLFFDANNPRNKQIMKGKAPTWIEISWIIPVVLVAIFATPLFIPLLVAFLVVRLYLVRLYELINPDWETDGTSTGIPTLEKIGDALDKVPSPSELEDRAAEIIANEIIEEYRDENSLFHRMLAPIIGFHKRNHKKKWFVLYVYFIAIFILIPLAIVLLFLELFVRGALANAGIV